MHTLSEAVLKAPGTEEGGCDLSHLGTECTLRGPYHLHHDDPTPTTPTTTQVLSLNCHISPSSEPSEALVCLFFHLQRPYSSTFLLFCIPHSPSSLHLSPPGSMCHLWCSMQHQRLLLKCCWVNSHEGMKPPPSSLAEKLGEVKGWKPPQQKESDSKWTLQESVLNHSKAKRGSAPD